jgi:hypothetical protein
MSAEFARQLSYVISDGEDLIRLFVEQHMQISEMWTSHMPMKAPKPEAVYSRPASPI